MSSRYRVRWLFDQGLPRTLLRWQGYRGDPVGSLIASPAGLHDPHPFIEAIRARGRMYRTPFAWVTSDYEISRSILRDSTFGVLGLDKTAVPDALQRFLGNAELPPNPVEGPSMLALDPPDHTRLRKSVSKAFTPRAIARLRDRVEAVTAELLDRLPEHGSADLITDFAAQLPIAIISDMLGFPQESKDRFLAWGDRTTPLLDFGISWRQWRDAVESMRVMDGYLDTHIARLRREPGEDILSSLVRDGDLDDRELKATATLLMGAGFETTVNLIGNGVFRLRENPDQLALLRADPALWPQAVEEILRYDAPITLTGRMALSDTEAGDIRLRRGRVVVISLTGANRDPRKFENPDAFDITRANAKDHLSFSSGIHICLGASLARMEATHALRSLFERYPDLTLAGAPTRRRLYTLYGYEHMPVRLGKRVSAPV
ncbi:cytochrome P450 [Nocardia huaxiensis]|uniref:Cytochrome P450 n=1 Tax=Nocardia huaxiensis TaxID=2755382 RepID=A0A7D6ZP08_9NOCA|nr:cytochrome P450 [Nocardia huaxiensis]QLY34320.1 cytochrome P450 [Nocardia huaxiensis]UFT00075.1 cytochrome P450 [Nocardia huaxiensis]